MKDRIKSLRRVPVSELIVNPKNWRKHPPAQKNALNGLLESVGWADAVLVRETDEGLMLIDGHLRKELADDSKIPVLVLDVTEAEADLILATHDPLTAMAQTDQSMLNELVDSIEIENDEAQELLDKLICANSEHDVDLSDQIEIRFGIEIDCLDENEQEQVYTRLKKEGIKCRLLTL